MFFEPSDWQLMKKFKKISVNTPFTSCDKVRKAMGDAGAGKVSGYTHCSFSIKGIGRSIPGSETNPFIGTEGEYENIEEEKIESFCEASDLKRVVSAIKEVHPYEEPVVTVQDIEVH